MSTAVLGRGLAENWRGLLITAVSISAMLMLALAIYQDMDLGIYDALPQAMRAVMGIPEHADASMMAYNEMLVTIGGLAFTGVAVAIGANAVAGDEQRHTLHLVLSTPLSRTRFALTKALAMVIVLIGAGAVLYALAELAPIVVGADKGDARLLAVMIHLSACAFFHGALAFGIGAATGRKGLAGGIAAFVMVGGWFAAGLLPMWKEGSADWIPWTWFNGSTPLVNGIDGGHLALLLGGGVLFIVAGIAVFTRRELRLHDTSSKLVARLTSNPTVAKIIAPTGAGSTWFGIRMASQQVLLGYVAAILALVMGLAMPSMWNAIDDVMGDFAASFPQSLGALFGGGDLTTPDGFLHMEIMGMVAPICVILVAVAAASSGIAGEESARRLSLLLAAPMSRGKAYWTAAAAMAVKSAIVALSLFLGMWGGVALAGIDEVRIVDLAWACVLLMLLGCFFGALALAIAAASGRSSWSVWGATGFAVATYFGYTMLLAAGKEDYGWFSPFRAYLYGPPLQQGIEWWQPVWLVVGTGLLLLIGLPLFTRRDLRIH